MRYILAMVVCMFSLFAQEEALIEEEILMEEEIVIKEEALMEEAKEVVKGEEVVMAKNPVIVMETTQGTIELELKPDIAPKACENMMKLAAKGYYDGIVFHRIIKQFMIQGGDPTGTGAGGESIWGKPFDDECTSSVTFNKPGILAMANAGPKTNGSQFFITTVETPWLNGNHTIFGEVTKGYEVIQKLEAVETGMQDKPVKEQKIIKMTVKQ